MSNIYIIDDHAMLREGLRTVLELAGHCVVGESAEPTQALADMVRLKPDAALLDLYLGERSGLEILEQAKERELATRFIVMSMSDTARHVAQSLRLGAFGYVLKDAPAKELLHAIETVAGGRKYLCSRASELAVEGLIEDLSVVRMSALSARERQVVQMVVRGRTSASIGQELQLSAKTVETYRSRVMSKLRVSNVPALVRLAIREGTLSAED